MSFVIRAALAIGILSWLALERQGASPADRIPGRADLAAARIAWEALPEAAREAAREVALREGGAAVIRHATAAAPTSGDTLMETDRRPPWRGAPGRWERTIP